ncbi:hypothetical protein GSI_05448 [Ganoderma sinense ZZ0214-1]|uniref:Mediator of RNA polymerase II transcription subunit 19 n=1 Tax=Ganoderma sinense ZZ0214-1 TaxID=1077348 RepID=A0A2G8SEM6_9APHY|nr:hypothetical protein GSI_05448 [Ganoderma sinense ZZ0214-1]
MDLDEQHTSPYPPHPNAVAGPSSMPDLPPLFLPPPGPPRRPPYLRSTEDLIKRFDLLPAYDKYVRPFAPPVGQPSATDKGKGKEIVARDAPASSPAAPTPAAANDGDDEDGAKGEKKFKNYKHLIKSVPGKHSMKKDDFLQTLMMVPPKQKMQIEEFSVATQQQAFAMSMEGLKGWNIHALVAESSQAREDRKRRKELKKLAKAQGQSLVQAAAGPNTPSGLPATPGVAPPRTSTPQPGVPKPPPPLQQPSQARGLTPVGIGTPQSVSTPVSQHQQPTPAVRGVKREREDTGLQMSGNVSQGAYGQDGAKSELRGTKAGTAGVRPRPIKKARLDGNGQVQMPIQQPTPHA